MKQSKTVSRRPWNDLKHSLTSSSWASHVCAGNYWLTDVELTMEFQCDCDYRKVINTKCFVYISHLRRTFRKTRNSFFSSSLSMNYKWAATMISILQLIFHIGIYRVGEWQANFDVYSTHQHIHAYTRICATSTDVVGGRYFYVCCRNKYHDFGISFFFFWVRKQNMCPSSVHEVPIEHINSNNKHNLQCSMWTQPPNWIGSTVCMSMWTDKPQTDTPLTFWAP